jgi:hypothetical protein
MCTGKLDTWLLQGRLSVVSPCLTAQEQALCPHACGTEPLHTTQVPD